MGRTTVQEATIANGGTVSSAIRADPAMVSGVEMPAAFTGTALAIHGCSTFGGTYAAVRDSDGNAVSLVVAADYKVGLSGAEADACAAFPFLKFVSNGAEGAARTIRVITRL